MNYIVSPDVHFRLIKGPLSLVLCLLDKCPLWYQLDVGCIDGRAVVIWPMIMREWLFMQYS